MITIIKPGRDISIVTCNICDCEFRYEPEDIRTMGDQIGQTYKRFVICPNCSNKIIIGPRIKSIEIPIENPLAGEPVKC